MRTPSRPASSRARRAQGERRRLQRLEVLRLSLARQPLGGRAVAGERDHLRPGVDVLPVQGRHQSGLLEQHAGGPERVGHGATASGELLAHAAVEKGDRRHGRRVPVRHPPAFARRRLAPTGVVRRVHPIDGVSCTTGDSTPRIAVRGVPLVLGMLTVALLIARVPTISTAFRAPGTRARHRPSTSGNATPMGIEYLKKATHTASGGSGDVRATVQGILDEIEAGGDAAALEYAATFDRYEGDIVLDAAAIEAASNLVPERLKADIRFAHDNVRRFAEAQKGTMHDVEIEVVPGLDRRAEEHPLPRRRLLRPPAGATATSPRRS